MKKILLKILKFRRTVSFAFAGKTITETWILFGVFKFSISKNINP